MSIAASLLFYSVLCVLASLAGGLVPHLVRLTHRRMQIAISFVSGVVLGIGLLHMIPHSLGLLGSIDRTMNWVLLGFLFMFFLERFFHFHQHEAPDDPALLDPDQRAAHRFDQHHDHDHDHGNEPHVHVAPTSWASAAIGLTLHGLVDGVALAAAVTAESGHVALAGIGAVLAICLHKPFDSLTIGTLLAAGGRTPNFRHGVNLAYALVTPLGVLLFALFAHDQPNAQGTLGMALAFAGGAFICIAASDLLPELQFHRHDLAALSIALIAGITLAWSTVFLEASGHDHLHSPATATHEHGHSEAEHDHEHN